MKTMHDTPSSPSFRAAPDRLSYKFQRLRERIRRAIEERELAGKLPGERQLAEQFNVNAKTLSKALTDLAAEGLLERTIGRGTFVRGSQQPAATRERWMIIDPSDTPSPLARLLAGAIPDAQIVSDVSARRPSFLNQFTTVVDLGERTPESVLRDLMVRNVQLVVAGREPAGLSVNCVAVDTMLGAACAARELMTAGHRTLAAVERPAQGHVRYALAQTAERFGEPLTVIDIADDELELALEQGVTGIVCDGADRATRVMRTLEKMGISVPGQVSVMGIGWIEAAPPCSGYFVSAAEMADAVVSLQRSSTRRPTTLWLAGRQTDAATTATVATPTADRPFAVSEVAMKTGGGF